MTMVKVLGMVMVMMLLATSYNAAGERRYMESCSASDGSNNEYRQSMRGSMVVIASGRGGCGGFCG